MSALNLSDAQLVVAVLRMESDLSRAIADVQILREELQRRLGLPKEATAEAPAAPAPAAVVAEGKKERKKREPLSEEAKKAMKEKAAATRLANKAKKESDSAASSVKGEESELEEGEVREAAPAPATPEKPKKAKKEKAPGAPKKEKKAKEAKEAAPAEGEKEEAKEEPKKEKKPASLGVLAWTAFKEGVRAEMKAAAGPEAKILSTEVMKVAKERKEADKAAYEKFVADYKAAHGAAPAEGNVLEEVD
jgi:hypothetical protein